MCNYQYLIVLLNLIVVSMGLPVNIPLERNQIADTPSDTHVNTTQIMNFMRKFGYLEASSSSTTETLYHEETIIAAIKNMQKFGALNETGVLDNATLKLLTAPRCGVADVRRSASALNTARVKRFALGSRGWKKRRITYYISNWSPKVGEQKVTDGMEEAFEIWSRYSGLKFRRVFQPDADIIVAFGSGYHGDYFPFDGPGNVLAHAFYPYELTHFGGDIHFDDDENWKENATQLSEGVDFRSVAVHELGHSLGLAHSPIFSSIMFPYYKGPKESQDLGYDDIMAMYELYIKNGVYVDEAEADARAQTDEDVEVTSTTTTTTTTTTDYFITISKLPTSYFVPATDLNTRTSKNTPTTTDQSALATEQSIDVKNENNCVESAEKRHRFSIPVECAPSTKTDKSFSPPNLCENPRFDAFASLRGEIFVFKGKYVWRFTENYQLVPGYPIQFSDIFPNIPNDVQKIDAIYERKMDGAIVLFYGKLFWVFDGFGFIENSPRPISEYGFDENVEQVDAAMTWSKNERTYLFSGTQFIRYDEEHRRKDEHYPKNISEKWHGIPNNIDAVTSMPNEKTYFFKGDLYWLYNDHWIRPERGYPRRTSVNWFGCSF